MKNYIIKTMLIAGGLSALLSFSALAGQWQQDATGWWYQNDDSSYPINQWQEIDGKQYYFNENGYMLSNTTTPDGYQVGPDGAWIQDGAAQTGQGVIDEQVDMELMVYRETTQNPNHWVEWENKTGMYLSVDFIPIKGWQYTFGQKKYDIQNEKPTPECLLRMTSDCKAVEIFAEFPIPEGYDSTYATSDFFVVRGKLCFSIEYIKWNLVRTNYVEPDGTTVYYQYDIINNQLTESSKEANEAMKVEGVYNPSDYLYYTFKDGALIGCNYKKEEVTKVNVAKIDLPEFYGTEVTGHSIKLSKVEGDIAYFKATISIRNRAMGWLRGGDFSESFTVRVDKNTGTMLGYEKIN